MRFRTERSELPVMQVMEAVKIAGPETAARLGVPVGTPIPDESREVRLYRSRIKQAQWRLSHLRAGRIQRRVQED